MSEEENVTVADPLSMDVDLKGKDTSIPKLPAGDYVFNIKEAKVVPKKDDTEGRKNLKVQFGLVDEAESNTGDTLKPGFPVSKHYPLQQSENPDAPDYTIDICRLFDAAFNCTAEERPNLNMDTISALVGCEVALTLSLAESIDKKTGTNYGLQNNIVKISAIE